MLFRLLAAAFAAALLATLGLMFARVASIPVGPLDTRGNDFLLLHHLGLGIAGGLALQVFLLYRPLTGIYRALTWGVAGFLALTLMPWLVFPDTMPGQVSGRHPLRWLIVAACTAGGLWLLWSPGMGEKQRRNRRLAGLGLVLLPLLVGAFGGIAPALPDGMASADLVTDSGADPGVELGRDLAVWRELALNLLFWLLLGLFSVVSARRVVQQPQGGTGGGARGGENPPGDGPGMP